ncbi:MAG TPA: DUF6186 family protein [Acidimicrobiales bacterium]|jgi:hypothetical protein|nr:DUF6186 family protein [Acidimicrobiales bacterium]HLN44049.1 DUF6186 family protein [Acidimicrobiales bacterium]
MIDRHITLIVWGVLGATVVLGQILAVAGKGGLPGLGALVGWVTWSRVGRYLLVVAWMWLGWHAFAR